MVMRNSKWMLNSGTGAGVFNRPDNRDLVELNGPTVPIVFCETLQSHSSHQARPVAPPDSKFSVCVRGLGALILARFHFRKDDCYRTGWWRLLESIRHVACSSSESPVDDWP